LALLKFPAELCDGFLDFSEDATLARLLQIVDLLSEIVLIVRQLGCQD
jgi:hypothetical protein